MERWIRCGQSSVTADPFGACVCCHILSKVFSSVSTSIGRSKSQVSFRSNSQSFSFSFGDWVSTSSSFQLKIDLVLFHFVWIPFQFRFIWQESDDAGTAKSNLFPTEWNGVCVCSVLCSERRKTALILSKALGARTLRFASWSGSVLNNKTGILEGASLRSAFSLHATHRHKEKFVLLLILILILLLLDSIDFIYTTVETLTHFRIDPVEILIILPGTVTMTT